MFRAKLSNRKTTLTGITAIASVCLFGAICNAQPQQPVSCGTFSSVVEKAGNQLSPERAAVSIMPSRSLDLLRTQEGYRRTGLSLLSYNEEKQRYTPAGFSDDQGMYYYVPWLARNLHISLDQSVALFLLTPMTLATLIGGWGILLALHTWKGRGAGLIAFGILWLVAYRLGDVYIFEFAVPAALVPWIVRFTGQFSSGRVKWLFWFGAGAVLGFALTVRSVAAIPTLVLAVVMLVMHMNATALRRLLHIGVVAAGMLGPVVAMRLATGPSNAFLIDKQGLRAEDLSRHHIGHSAYLGLGFLANRYVPGGVCDETSIAEARALAPKASYLSDEYDQALRHQVVAIALQSPLLVLFTIAAKLGIVLVTIAIFANIGLAATISHPKPLSIELAFWSALAASALPVLLVAPLPHYLLGVFTISALYGIFSIDHAVLISRGGVGEQDLAGMNQYYASYLTRPDRDQELANRAPAFVRGMHAK